MTILEAIILGVVEGLTEFIPVSSTGHLIIVAHLLELQQSEAVKTFEVAIQSGAILSVLFLYGRKFFLNKAVVRNVIAAFIPTAIIGASLYGFIKTVLIGNLPVVAGGLFIGGIALIGVERYWRSLHSQESHSDLGDTGNTLESLPWQSAALVGVAQSFAIVPGVSRSAASMVGGMLVGLGRREAAEFSFLLAVPTILASGAFDFIQTATHFPQEMYTSFLVGLGVSFVVATIVIRLFIAFLQKHSLSVFGYYRVVVALLIVFFLI